jgi:AsmA protein
MKRVFWILGGIALLFAAALGLAAWLLDAEALRQPLATAASDALGRDVKLGSMHVDLLPLPSVEVRDLSVAGEKRGDPPFAELAALRLRVALWPLFAGRVLVSALELERPEVAVPLDREGDPVLPGPRKPSGGTQPAAEAGTAPALAIQRIVVRDASVRYGAWTATGLDLEGSLGLDQSIEFDLRTDVSGPLQARGTRVQADLKLAKSSLAALDAVLDVDELVFSSGGTELRGPAHGSATLGREWKLDLSDAALRVPGALHKQPGTALALSGKLGPELGVQALAEVLLELGRAQLTLVPDLEGGRASASGRVEIEQLAGVLDPALPLRGGAVELQGLGAEFESRKLFGRAQLERLVLDGPKGPIELSGTVIAAGNTLTLEGGHAVIGGENVEVGGSYDLGRGSAKLRGGTQGAKIGSLAAAVYDDVHLDGTLVSSAQLELAPGAGIETLRGQGRIDIRPGEIRGFSLLRQVLGELAALPLLVAKARGKDLSRFEQEEFEELSADFVVQDGKLSTENLLLRYAHGKAELRGSVGLVDRALDLRGRLELSREVDAELGKTQGEPTVIPIAHIGGTVGAPRVRLDRETLAQVALAYAGKDRVREKLEEKLGKEGASAVDDILDKVLGGSGKQP